MDRFLNLRVPQPIKLENQNIVFHLLANTIVINYSSRVNREALLGTTKRLNGPQLQPAGHNILRLTSFPKGLFQIKQAFAHFNHSKTFK
jgi:hypothetical protein